MYNKILLKIKYYFTFRKYYRRAIRIIKGKE